MIHALDLFSGIGGMTLGLRGYIKTVAYCEIDEYARTVLFSRMADASIETAKRVEERAAQATEAAASFTPAQATSTDADLIRAIARGEVRSHEFNREARAALVPSANTVGQSFYDQVFGVARLVGPMLNTSEVINIEGIWFEYEFTGQGNTDLTDYQYRLAIKLKIATNQSDTALASLQNQIAEFFPGQIQIRDNKD